MSAEVNPTLKCFFSLICTEKKMRLWNEMTKRSTNSLVVTEVVKSIRSHYKYFSSPLSWSPKVHTPFLYWGKQDYLIEGAMVRDCLFFQTSEWESRQFWSFRGKSGKLNITFTVAINHKQKAPVEIHSFDLKWKELLAC